jgi:hypothetical protein
VSDAVTTSVLRGAPGAPAGGGCGRRCSHQVAGCLARVVGSISSRAASGVPLVQPVELHLDFLAVDLSVSSAVSMAVAGMVGRRHGCRRGRRHGRGILRRHVRRHGRET